MSALTLILLSMVFEICPLIAGASPPSYARGADALAAAGSAPPPAQSAFPGPSTTVPNPAPLVPPRTWILVDADTAKVIAANTDHLPLPPASTTKLLTAIMAETSLPSDASVPVSPVAQGMPAESINMKAGQVWPLSDAMHALLMVSANDAAVALAERMSGSREAFGAHMYSMAGILGLVDHPVLQDPAGLDGQFAVGNGNRISAYDLAIMGRAALAIPDIRQIVGLPVYRFHGVDGIDHRLRNHDGLLEQYPGTIGVKLGYTVAAGDNLVAAATRGGRTMLAVVMHAPSVYADAAALLDEGFATPAVAETGIDHLPPVRLAAPAPPPVATTARRDQPDRLALGTRHGQGQATTLRSGWVALGGVALFATSALVAVSRLRSGHRRRARRRVV